MSAELHKCKLMSENFSSHTYMYKVFNIKRQ